MARNFTFARGLGAVAFALGTGIAAAQSPAVAPHRAPSLDQGFMHEAVELDTAEVDLGHIAVQRGANDNVRSFAQQMVDAHRKNKDKLSALAAKQGIPLPTKLNQQHRVLRDRLSHETGITFDRAYMKAMVVDHRKAVRMYEREAAHGQDKAVRDLAKDQLDTLKSHLKLAQNIDQRLQIGKTRGPQ